MSRRYPPTADAVYRVVVEHLVSDQSSAYMAQTYGPYSTRGVARGRLNSELHNATRGGRKARGFIERSSLNWTQLEDDK